MCASRRCPMVQLLMGSHFCIFSKLVHECNVLVGQCRWVRYNTPHCQSLVQSHSYTLSSFRVCHARETRSMHSSAVSLTNRNYRLCTKKKMRLTQTFWQEDSRRQFQHVHVHPSNACRYSLLHLASFPDQPAQDPAPLPSTLSIPESDDAQTCIPSTAIHSPPHSSASIVHTRQKRPCVT